jgi:hypothetical protein
MVGQVALDHLIEVRILATEHNMPEKLPNHFHSIVPVGKEFLVRKHDRLGEKSTFATQVFLSASAAEAYITEVEKPRPAVAVEKKTA